MNERRRRRRSNLLKVLALIIFILVFSLFKNAIEFSFNSIDANALTNFVYVDKESTLLIEFYNSTEGVMSNYSKDPIRANSFIYVLDLKRKTITIDYNRADIKSTYLTLVKGGLLDAKANVYYYQLTKI